MPSLEALENHRRCIAGAKNQLGAIAPTLRGEIVRYLELGQEPGLFLRAVLDNNLRAAVWLCPDVSWLKPLLTFLEWEVPADAAGSREKREAWQAWVEKLWAESEAEELDRPTIPDLEISTSQLPEGAVPVYAEEPGPEPIKVPPVDARAQGGEAPNV